MPPQWTPSIALETDCDGNRVTRSTTLSIECIYQKKVAEIKAKQAIQAENGGYKVEKLRVMEKRAEEAAVKRAERAAEIKAAQAKYATRR